jgi:Skp family chaperone for outer membrane proteins
MRGIGRLIGGIAALGVIIIVILGILNMQAVEDWLRLRNYSPPANIAALAKADTMTEKARRDFYVTHPQLISGNSAFRQACPGFEQTIVLGCYHSGYNSSIYIYNVSDKRLDGVVEVTAAHEMLHSAYDRLSSGDKQHINNLLNDFYSNGLRDQRVLDTIDSYKKTEPNDVMNEMHSIFGTEIKSLPRELENYYSRYFSKRAAVADFADNYASEFSNRSDKIKEYERELAALKTTIDNQEVKLDSQLAQIQAERRRMDQLRASGQTSEYNSAVPGFNALVNDYNSGIGELKDDISRYNQLVAAHNTLAEELSGLYKSLDTGLAPQPSH